MVAAWREEMSRAKISVVSIFLSDDGFRNQEVKTVYRRGLELDTGVLDKF
jgi:hypothetical protein